MRGKTRAAIIGACALVLTLGGTAIVQAATAPTPVAKLCKHGTTNVYSKATCRTGDTPITLKGVVGKTGATGAQGIQGVPGVAGPAGPESLVRKCASVTVNADYESGDIGDRRLIISGLPQYSGLGGLAAVDAMFSTNAGQVSGGVGTIGLSIYPGFTPTIGSTSIQILVSPNDFTGTESFPLQVCAARLALANA